MSSLQNLFSYIRDLYNTSEPCFDFEKETNNVKFENKNYWKIANLIAIAKQCENQKINDFKFIIGNNSNEFDFILKIKRIKVPLEPAIPYSISEWVLISEDLFIPKLSIKKQIEVFEKFNKSQQRINDLELFKNQVKSNPKDNKLPNSLVGWVDIIGNEVKCRQEKKVVELFENDEKRIKDVNEFQKLFNDYYFKNETPIKSNKIYDALHTLNYELKGKDAKRLYLSFGLLNGVIGNVTYKNFLFHVPLKISLKSQEITLEAETFSNKIFCEQHFVELFDVHFAKEGVANIIQRKKETIETIDKFNLKHNEFYFDANFIRSEYYNNAIDTLGVFNHKEDIFFKNEKLNFEFENLIKDNQITFSFSPIIQTKLVESQIDTSRDANNIINKINELQANSGLNQIPDFFKKLFVVEDIEPNAPTQIDNSSDEVNNTEADFSKYTDAQQKFLFPLPFNEEQFEIVKRLQEQDAVTVKGPPGTGKSHTIANIISHFVAHGKSILVVSHNSKALSVVKDKLPKEIQELAVSLANEGKGNELLKASVDAIIRNYSQRYEEARITELELELRELELNYANTLNNLYKVVKVNSSTFKVYNPFAKSFEEKTAYEWAVIHFNSPTNKPELIQDNIHYDLDTLDLVDDLVKTALIGNKLQESDFDLVNYEFLEDENFIEIQELRVLENQLNEIAKTINIEDYQNLELSPLSELLINEINNFEQHFNDFEKQSIANFLLKHPKYHSGILKNLLVQNDNLRQQIIVADEKLLSYQLDLSPLEDTDPDILFQQINQLIIKFSDNKTLSWLSKSILDKNLKKFFECKVNFIQATEIEQFKTIELAIVRNKCIKQLSITFNNFLSSFSFQNQLNIEDTLRELDFTINFEAIYSNFNTLLKQYQLPEISLDPIDVKSKVLFFKNVQHYEKYIQINKRLKNEANKLQNHTNAHPLIYKIAEDLLRVDRNSYEIHLDDYRNQRDKSKIAISFDDIFNKISKVVPLTAQLIKIKCIEDRAFQINKEVCEADIFTLKVNDFLTFITNQTKGADKYLASLQNLKKSIENQTTGIIAYKSWYHKTKSISITQKAALTAWKNDLINIGKGYGKNTARNMASAVANMQIAKGAVPIWIMPQDKAISFFPDATPNQFDLLIIDEASQCDISSLNLIFRCKKCLIVGDENQTSVVSDKQSFSIDRTNDLLDKYLITHRFKTQFDVNNKNNSIYTISGVIYPNIVTLTEHFRCLPEIIGYSNKYIYNNDIIPLKTATEKLYGEPLSIHYVEDNHLDEQKPLIVDKVIQEIENLIISFREEKIKKLPTVGVLTLDSSNLKHNTHLIKLVAKSELIKEYEDELELLIGTSREFQGDERDIMILTITASHSFSERHNYDIRPPRAATTEEYMRIFNVAASRAKEKSILIHSIHPDAIGLMNPDCYRRKIIDYYSNQQNITSRQNTNRNLNTLLNMTDPRSGEFEKSVCKFLYNSGYGDFITPQFEVGKYSIDFGVIKNNKKLAIECDGFTFHTGFVKIHEDINRQLILERAGWRFFRIQSTDWFYRHPVVSSDLYKWLIENE